MQGGRGSLGEEMSPPCEGPGRASPGSSGISSRALLQEMNLPNTLVQWILPCGGGDSGGGGAGGLVFCLEGGGEGEVEVGW